jgi:ABC-type antimicrobial peptide transport system permease subunit
MSAEARPILIFRGPDSTYQPRCPALHHATDAALSGIRTVLMGIYAVVSYAVTQRTHEMGVRLALGTTSARLRTVLLGQGLVSVLCGTLGGVLAAVLAGRLLESLVEGASALNPAAYLLAVPSTCLIAALSIWTATRRITRLDVMEILRAE